MVRVFRSNQFQGRKVQETTHFAAAGGAAAGALEGLEPSAQGLLGVSLPTPKALTMRAWSASRKKRARRPAPFVSTRCNHCRLR